MLIDFRQLFPKYRIKPKGVLHVGANIGEESKVYHDLGIRKVVWIEGNPEIFAKLKANVSRFPGQTCMNYCISDTNDEDVAFHVSSNGSQSSSLLEFGTHSTAHPDVKFVYDLKLKTKRLDSIVKSADLDFLNLDLQGAEMLALRGMGDLLRQFKWAYIEVNQAELYKGCPHVNDLDLFLLGFGFKRVETKWCGNTGWGDALYIKR